MLADDVCARLISASVAVDNTTLFKGSGALLPKVRETTFLHVVSYPGPAGSRTQNDGAAAATRMPRAQVVARGAKAAEVWAMAQAAHVALRLTNTVIGATFYLTLRPIQDEPFDMGPDDAGRMQVGFNVAAECRADT